MKKAGVCFENISDKVVKGIALVLVGVLTVWTAMYTDSYPREYLDYLVWSEDNPVKNLTVAAAVILLAGILARFCFRGKEEEQRQKAVQRYAIAVIAVVGIVLAVWVAWTDLPPSRDGRMVFNLARRVIDGDYSEMEIAYWKGHQHLYGLVFPAEILLRIWDDYHIFQYLNVIFVMGIIYFLYRITEWFFHNPVVNFYCLTGSAAFISMLLYVSHVYGDIPSISLSLMAVWAMLRWCDTGKKRYVALAAAGLAVATMVRMNTLIAVIAILLCLAVYAWRKWDWRPMAAGALILAVTLGSMQMVPWMYEKRSGISFGDTIPAVMYIAMGMQGEEGGYGIYNGYHESVFWHTGGDAKESSRIAMEYIQETLKQFAAYPPRAYDFYKNKTLQQWSETTYGSLLHTFSEERAEDPLVRAVYLGKGQDRMSSYQNYYGFFVYLGAFLYLIQRLLKKDGIWQNSLMITIIGGILFSLLWENKSRYVLPYVVCMIPYMAYGIWGLQNGVERLVRNFSKKLKK